MLIIKIIIIITVIIIIIIINNESLTELLYLLFFVSRLVMGEKIGWMWKLTEFCQKYESAVLFATLIYWILYF